MFKKSCLCLLGVLLGCSSWARSQNKPIPTVERWFDVTHMGEEVFAPKKPLVLTPAQAVQIFQIKSPHLAKDWQGQLQKSDLRSEELREAKIPGKHVFKFKMESAALVEVRQFSNQHLQVMILKPYGYYLWHRYYECLADFQIPRTPAVDKLFDVPALERSYGTRIKGIGYGDSMPTVVKALGEPDGTVSYQPFGMFTCAFFDEDVVIHFENFVVKTITRGVPENWKREVQEGEHITHF